MHYGEADLNNPIIRNQFMNDFNTYRNKKQKNTLTPDYINKSCLLYTSPSPRDAHESRMPSSA